MADTELFVFSIYICKKEDLFYLRADFDAINQVDCGEGWSWTSASSEVSELVKVLEVEIGTISLWENISKSGKLLDYYGEIDAAKYQNEYLAFSENLMYGEQVLPEYISWSKLF